MDTNDASGWGTCSWEVRNESSEVPTYLTGTEHSFSVPTCPTDHTLSLPSFAAQSSVIPRSTYTEMCSPTSGSYIEDEEMGEDCPEMYRELTDGGGDYFACQMSPEAYRQQTKIYTKSALDDLIKSPEYLRKVTRCTLCWCIWSEDMCTGTCTECGGFAMQRPCPVCDGRCGQVWIRDVDMSHSNNKAFWDGSCGLPEEEQHRYMTSHLMEDGTEESVLDAMGDLSTG